MTCEKCGKTLNSANVKSCMHCGYTMCSSCAKENNNVCRKCGFEMNYFN